MRYSVLLISCSIALLLLFGLRESLSDEVRVNSGRVQIYTSLSDDEIRAKLLSYTPFGTNSLTVLDFVRLRLDSEGIGSTIGLEKFYPPVVSSVLGHRRTGLFSQESTQAFWKFDAGRKLRGIVIRRFPYEEGSWFKPSDFIPQVTVNLRQSNEEIRRVLLTYTPRGSSYTTFGRFIDTRLYTQCSGAGVLLTSREGDAVILGEYADHASESRYSVRAVWIRDGNQRLKDVEVSRIPL